MRFVVVVSALTILAGCADQHASDDQALATVAESETDIQSVEADSVVGDAEQLASEFDFSAIEGRFGDRYWTVSEVTDAVSQAQEAFDSGDCAEALPLLVDAQRKSNQISNLIQGGLRPFYDASYDQRRSFTAVGRLVGYENSMNEYRETRNRLMVYEAECLLTLGQRNEGIVRLYRALELIPISNRELWDRARTKLYEELEVE
ncbi:hypothetical protein [Glycocaulis sp.]|uniref:hypothetical protein n=1 Tax=Glycocaulis sp. TaxID=1969725 RepID=UPI003D1B7BC5